MPRKPPEPGIPACAGIRRWAEPTIARTGLKMPPSRAWRSRSKSVAPWAKGRPHGRLAQRAKAPKVREESRSWRQSSSSPGGATSLMRSSTARSCSRRVRSTSSIFTRKTCGSISSCGGAEPSRPRASQPGSILSRRANSTRGGRLPTDVRAQAPWKTTPTTTRRRCSGQ